MYIKLREMRLSRKLTLKELSEITKISVNTLSLIETNEVDCKVSTLCKISSALDAPLTQLVDCEKDSRNNIRET
jgi:transcriptional regulator with XRE-family HTH domain